MAQEKRGRIVWALILIAVGLYLFATQAFPALRFLGINETNWPLILVGVGAAILLGALLTWTPGLMVPAAISGGVGALMFWQNATGDWGSWAYAWTLIPVFSGVGVFLMHLMEGKVRQAILAAGIPVFGGLIAFLILGSFFGTLGLFGQSWPLLLILLGGIVLAQTFWKRA